MKIAIASGKGGTGKTLVSTNLAHLLAEAHARVCLVDCDVEAPNCHLFFPGQPLQGAPVSVASPHIDKAACMRCGKCARACRYGALAQTREGILIFPELCHSCGACARACPTGALTYADRPVGVLESGANGPLNFVFGKMNVGEAMATPLIKAARTGAQALACDIEIIDCPPGSSCPVIAAARGADFVYLVTEPTPFGLHDLQIAVAVVRALGIPCAIVLNRCGDNDALISDYARAQNIAVEAKIPYDRRIAAGYSGGALLARDLPEFTACFAPLLARALGNPL